MRVVMEGYTIKDGADFTLADFEDATKNSTYRDGREMCESQFDSWACTRLIGHTGPHAAASGEDAICAIWEGPDA